MSARNLLILSVPSASRSRARVHAFVVVPSDAWWGGGWGLVSIAKLSPCRFTLDDNDYIQALRLFVGTPVWTPLNRPQEEHPIRKKYVEEIGAGGSSGAEESKASE